MSGFERWPGYDEQSWQQRFVELDRRYAEQQNKSIEFAKRVIEERCAKKATTGADALVVKRAREVNIEALTRYVREHAGSWSSPYELGHINALSRLKAALSAIDEGRGG